jgi:serine/threonine protein kinase
MVELKTQLQRGNILREYRIDSMLGGGGFSKVYLAIHIPTKNKVVIKEYCPEDMTMRMPGGRVVPVSKDKAAAYAAGIKRFFSEASALVKVNHPNIVRVSNVFRANNTVYMVMDYEKGTDLRWYIKKHSAGLSEKFLYTVFPELLTGVDAMHALGLLHLDIKPANVLLRPGGRPLLLDFGAAQHYLIGSHSPWAQTLTVGFAPPEQHERGHLGPWSDIYAIGATMYSCISGRAPQAAPDRVKKDKLTPAVKAFGRRYSKHLLQTIDWALKLDYRERPRTAREMLAAGFAEQMEIGEPEPEGSRLMKALRRVLRRDAEE